MSLVELVAKELRQQPSSITDDTGPKTLKAWDSMRHLVILAKVERAYGVKFSTADVVSIKSVRDLRALLLNKGKPAE